MFTKSISKGFSLAEVLIALALLGVICALMIPKILQGVGDAERKAKFKQTISMLDQIQTEGLLNSKLRLSNMTNYYLKRINGKTCSTNSSTEGCWDRTKQGDGFTGLTESQQPGVLLPTGVAIVGLDSPPDASQANGILVDWNGTKGPNQFGEDQMWLLAVLSKNDLNFGGTVYPGGTINVIGTCVNDPACSALMQKNLELYNKVMQ